MSRYTFTLVIAFACPVLASNDITWDENLGSRYEIQENFNDFESRLQAEISARQYEVVNDSATSMDSATTGIGGTFATITGSAISLIAKKSPAKIHINATVNCLRGGVGTDNAYMDVTMDGNGLKQDVKKPAAADRLTFHIDFTTITTQGTHSFTLRAKTDTGTMDCPSQITPTDFHDFRVKEE